MDINDHLASADAPLGVARLVDAGIAGTALLFTLPVILLAALALSLCDRGPLLVRATDRGVGFHPLRFCCTGGAQAHDADPRSTVLTPVGRALWRTRIDQLPGLWDVLAGRCCFARLVRA